MNIIDLLKKYDEKYEQGVPEISDTEYDKLRETAQELHPEDPYFKDVGAPKGKVKLPYHLGSLNKVKTDSVVKWLLGRGSGIYVISEKVDGASFMVEYQDGEVIAAYRRGDGERGHDITDKAKLFCPKIDFGGYWAFRGEAILPNPSDFGYKNRRNGAAGLLNKDESTNCQHIRPWFFEIIETDITHHYSTYLDAESGRWNLLEEIFPVNTPGNWLLDSQELEIENRVEERLIAILKNSRIRDQLYDVDGLVLTVDKSERENVAYPENKVAFKVNLDAVKTIITGIDWKLTRTGLVCATLEVAPTDIQGVTIQRVGAGINWKIMQEEGMGIGAEIGIVRSGDVIPYVEEVYVPSDNFGDIDFCPSCGGNLGEEGVWIACLNEGCHKKLQWKLEWFLRTLGAENLTIVTVEKIVDSGLLELTVDEHMIRIYDLTVEDFMKIEGFGKKRATQVYNEIQSTLKTTHEKLLAAFGIPNVGTTNSVTLIEHFGDVGAVLLATYESLTEVEGVGQTVANYIKGYQSLCRSLYYDLMTYRDFELEEREVGPLTGSLFAITGKLPMSRDNMVRLIESKGGRWKNSVTKRTHYLITDNPNSGTGKNKKAQQYGTKLITFDEFQELIS